MRGGDRRWCVAQAVTVVPIITITLIWLVHTSRSEDPHVLGPLQMDSIGPRLFPTSRSILGQYLWQSAGQGHGLCWQIRNGTLNSTSISVTFAKNYKPRCWLWLGKNPLLERSVPQTPQEAAVFLPSTLHPFISLGVRQFKKNQVPRTNSKLPHKSGAQPKVASGLHLPPDLRGALCIPVFSHKSVFFQVTGMTK